jgi:hypothetical protein
MILDWPILLRDKNNREKERKGFGVMHRSSIFPDYHFDNRSYYSNANCVHVEFLLQQILCKTIYCRSLGIGCIVEPLITSNVNFDYKARVEMINHPLRRNVAFYGIFVLYEIFHSSLFEFS